MFGDDLPLARLTKGSVESSDDEPLAPLKRLAAMSKPCGNIHILPGVNRARTSDNVTDKRSDNVSATERCFDLYGMGKLKELPQSTIDVALTFLTSRNVRLISWTCPALQHMIESKDFFVCASCVASESRLLEIAARQVAGDLSSGHAGGQVPVMRALPRIVDAVDVLSLLQDTKVKMSTKQLILHLNVPTVCTDAKGQLYCHATGFQGGGSRKEQCRFMKRKFAGLALGSVTKLKVLVTEPTMQTGSLGPRAADALKTRLGRLYRGCGASAVAAISAFPNLISLDIDVKLKGHVADRFWEAMVLALDGQGRIISDLSLNHEELLEGGEDQSRHVDDDVGPFCDLFRFSGDNCHHHNSLAHWLLGVAKQFPALAANSLSCHPAVLHKWQRWHARRGT